MQRASYSLPAELGISPDEALLVLKVANIHKDAGLLGKSQEAVKRGAMALHAVLCLTSMQHCLLKVQGLHSISMRKSWLPGRSSPSVEI